MKEVLIEIKGTQNVDGQNDVTELTTVGKMESIAGKTYLRYDDRTGDADNPISCLIKIDPNDDSVVMQRSGSLNSRMYIKKGQRHICHYETLAGTFTMGIFGENTNIKIDSSSAEVFMSYTIDINHSLMSRNSVEIKVKEV